MQIRNRLRGILATVAVMLSTAPFDAVAGATLFTEGFESIGPSQGGGGPVNLESQGWIFSIQATQSGDELWHEGPECAGCFVDWPAQEGDHYLVIGDNIVQGPGDSGSAWAVLPAVAGQGAESVLSFHLRGFPNGGDMLEVRYSPSGGVNTGAGPFDHGDFTQLLYQEDLWTDCGFPSGCPMHTEWYGVEIDIPGPGRLAIRYVVTDHAGGSGSHVAIDTLAIGSAASQPPFPESGETAHWDLAGSPYIILNDRTIPAGATVIVDPGVRVDLASDKELLIQGELTAEGIEGQPVVFAAPDQTARIATSEGGILRLDHCEVRCHINVAAGNIFGSAAGELIATDTLFQRPAIITGSLQGHARSLLVFLRCTFDAVKLQNTHCQADIRDSIFVDAGQSGVLLLGYLYLDGVSFDNSQLHIGAPRGPQPMYLNNVSVTNYADGGGLLLTNAQNFLLGPDNTIQGNMYPVEFGANVAGLLSGSIVPSAGNTRNVVSDAGEAFDPVGSVVWAPIDVPYLVEEWRFMGATTVLPGTTVQFEPAAGFGIESASDLIALGEPGKPVTFEGVDGGTWDGLSYLFIGSGARLDHCVIRGANTGAALVETTLKVDNCVFESNVVGLTSGGFRSVTRGSRFIANATGISGPFNANGLTNPNTFAGNGVGVAGALEDTAVGNWWGDPSGPNAPNYAGGGDIIVGPVAFEPFLVSEPDPGVHPPTVRLLECPTPSYEPGAKVIFQWTIREDQDIAHQRILFSDFGHYPENFVVIADNLHPDVRSFEFVVPDVGIDVANEHQAFRIEAVDSAGRVGWDEQAMYISVEGLAGDVEFTSDFDQQFEPGSSLAVTWNSNNLDPLFTSGQATLLLDPDSEFVPLPSSSVSAGQLPALIEMPDVSTDSARIMLTATGGLNRRKVFFSPEFSIRPDARIGDAPPSITISSPSPVNFEGGTAVPIRWDASDDEGIRSFLIMASYDGGGVWRRITDDLPASTRAFAWQLPTSSGIDDVRLRVVARDTRFQNSSDSVSITITPGELTPGVNGDTNGDGVVNFTDLNTVLAGFGQTGAGLPGDLNGDGVVDFSDLNEVLTNFGA